VFLTFKMFFCAFYTGLGRGSEGRPVAPEDKSLRPNKDPSGYGAVTDSPPQGMSRVDRGQAMHRNDMENIPIFILIAILLHLSGHNSKRNSYVAHIVFYSVFAFARLGHTVSYMFALQPHRSICYFLGVVTTAAAAIHLVVQVFTPVTVI